MSLEPAGQEAWQLPKTGPEVALQVRASDPSGARSASAAQVSAFISEQDRLHRDRYHAPLVSFTLEDCTLLEQPYRSVALWDRLTESRSQGVLSQLKLSLDKVRPAQAPASWFALAAQAGVSEIAFDAGARRINDVYPLLKDLATLAVQAGIAPHIPLPLAGEGIDLVESAFRAVVVLKGVLPWKAAPAELSPELRQSLAPHLREAVEKGTTDTTLLGDLVLGPWFQHLPPSNRRALFPVWIAANPQGQVEGSHTSREEALAGLNPQLKAPLTEWLRARA
jgi:hypothetical protein